MTIIRGVPAKPEHQCDIPAPNDWGIGTVAKCDGCGRSWRLSRKGVTFKGWRRTFWTALRDQVRLEGGWQRWADVRGD